MKIRRCGEAPELQQRLGLAQLHDLSVQLLALLQILGGVVLHLDRLDVAIEGRGVQLLDGSGALGQNRHALRPDIGEAATDVDALAGALALGDDDDADPEEVRTGA